MSIEAITLIVSRVILGYDSDILTGQFRLGGICSLMGTSKRFLTVSDGYVIVCCLLP